jgi:hypothetical protein
MTILLEDPHTKVGREDILKVTDENESLHESSSCNGIGVVNYSKLKSLNHQE